MAKRTTKFPSELRYDIVSKDWVVVATGRAKRPEMFKQEKREKERAEKSKCPFCNIDSREKPILIFSKGKKATYKTGDSVPNDWTTIVVPNRYPAFVPSTKLTEHSEGRFYKTIVAAGFHEVVITKEHKQQIAQFSKAQIKEVIDAYQARYQELSKKKFVNHISIFHNQGQEAGASISHPHSQIITTPLVDNDLQQTLRNTELFFKEEGSCIYCLMNNWERKVKKRLVFENENFLVLCPFASKMAFQVIISPKKHLSYFEKISEQEKWDLSEAFGAALGKIYRGLRNPAYNFYLHTSPCDGKKYPFFHWHWTILPKTSIHAGFEIGTRMEISTITPEKAADYLKKQ